MLTPKTRFSAVAAFALACGLCPSLAAQIETHTFSYTGTTETFTVPHGAVMLTITANGGSGGMSEGLPGGGGGRVRADLVVSQGETFSIRVGRRGHNSSVNGGGGGGATWFEPGASGHFGSPLLVAGGGGGRNYGSTQTGGAGGALLNGLGHGGGAPADAGGGGGRSYDGAPGTAGAGGRAAIGGPAGGAGGGGGGNGGYGGGGGGGPLSGGGGGGFTGGAGGGGGSNGTGPSRGGRSYFHSSLERVEHAAGTNTGNGSLVIDVHYHTREVHVFPGSSQLQTFVVPAGAESVQVIAYGGRGGKNSAGAQGANGGRCQATYALAPGTVLKILAGKGGKHGSGVSSWNVPGGGGGGSFVAIANGGYQSFATPLVVAGGGAGCPRTGYNPTGATGGKLTYGNGAQSGQGGQGGSDTGGGGGGITGNGGGFAGGEAAVNGGAGGNGLWTYADGGFGGGGGAYSSNQLFYPAHAGGGGGHTGGRGGSDTDDAQGGYSYRAPGFLNKLNIPGGNSERHGRVEIVVNYPLPTVTNVGSGCDGNALAAMALPWVGGSFTTRGTGLPSNAIVVTVTGFAPTSVPLSNVMPEALPGCDLLVTPDLTDAQLTGDGTMTSTIAIPATLGLIGQQLWQQMVPLAVDASFTITEVTATKAVHATIG
ncbi:MAG: hypothetical protein KAI24_14810 [Planctomycetes bacterium]|nr:hypothetical protein [Planctomycetota bacterium]